MVGRPEAIEDTGRPGHHARRAGHRRGCYHTDPPQVERLVERIAGEQGRLDILVNDIWGGDSLTEWGKPFWECELETSLHLLQGAVHTHIITARLAVPLMLSGKSGLVVEVGDGDGYWYRGSFFYDLTKVTVLRMAWAMAQELRPHSIAAPAVTPGFLRSEAVLDHFRVAEVTWRDAIAQDPHFAQSETPYYLGRGGAALAGDPGVMSKTGGAFNSGDLAEAYGFADVDGRRPHWMRYFREHFSHLLAVTPPMK